VPPSQRSPVPLDLDEVQVEARPLPFEKAEDSLPDVGVIVSRIAESMSLSLGDEGVKKLLAVDVDTITPAQMVALLVPLLPSARTLFEQLDRGMIKRLVPALLFSTTAIAPVGENGAKERLELAKSTDRAKLFDAYPDAYFPILFFAGIVTYKRFFPASVLSAFMRRKTESGATP
jgi:hypothetical protein